MQQLGLLILRLHIHSPSGPNTPHTSQQCLSPAEVLMEKYWQALRLQLSNLARGESLGKQQRANAFNATNGECCGSFCKCKQTSECARVLLITA